MELYGQNKEYIGRLIQARLKSSANNICDINTKLCNGNLGISRKDMPQITSDKVLEFLESLRKKGIKVNKNKWILVKNLKLTQNELDADKVNNLIETPATEASPIIVSSDGFIMDGSHRWAALFISNPASRMLCHEVDLPIKELLKEANSFKGVEKRDLDGKKVASILLNSVRKIKASLNECL